MNYVAQSVCIAVSSSSVSLAVGVTQCTVHFGQYSFCSCRHHFVPSAQTQDSDAGVRINNIVIVLGSSQLTAFCCTFSLRLQAANTYEKSAAALLGGSVYSLLLLSSEPKVKALGVQVAFAGLRFALAATQTTSFPACLDNTFPPVVDAGLYTGELHTALQLVPILSGKFGTFTAATPSQLGPDGTRVICASIGMMSFARGWQRNLMWQGAADIVNALYSTIETTGLLTKDQRKELCVSTRAVYTFIKTDPQNNPLNPVGPAVIAAPAIPPLNPTPPINPLTEFDWSCSTTQAACSGGPAWLSSFNANKPQLVAGHDFTPGTPNPLTSTSPFVRVCAAAFSP